MAEQVDPDELVPVPVREVAASLAVVNAIARAFDGDPELAHRLAAALEDGSLPPHARLPEVGGVDDPESARLLLDRLDARLRSVLPGAFPELDPPPVTRPLEGSTLGLPIHRMSRSLAFTDNDLAHAFVWWDDIALEDIQGYDAVLHDATDERPLQRHLAANPLLLAQHLRGGHGRYVLPQKRLGSDYVCDFALAEVDSGGFHWTWVELQSPTAKLFVPSSGRQSAQFDEGVRQINEWRRWLADNRDYARRPRAQNGLGLQSASAEDLGLVIIGREIDLTDEDRQRRRQLEDQYRVRIHTYDWITREARARIDDLARTRQSRQATG